MVEIDEGLKGIRLNKVDNRLKLISRQGRMFDVHAQTFGLLL